MDCSEIQRLFEKAESLRQKSLYTESLDFFKKALRGYSSQGDLQRVLDCRLSIGDVHRMIGNYDLAGKSYSHAAALGKRIGDMTAVADAETNIGLSLRGKGDWKNALAS